MASPDRDLKALSASERAADVDEVATALEEEMERRNVEHKAFIADYDLKDFIKLHRQPLFEFEAWEEDEIQFMIDNCTQVLAILILCGAYAQMQSIRALFFGPSDQASAQPALTDEQLWIDDESELIAFLPTGQMRRNFMSLQYKMKPYRFKEEMPSVTLVVPPQAHLPFKDEVHNVGVGGYGRISKVLVAYKYLVRANLSEYSEDEWCALKQIQASDAFLQEVRQLQILKESLTSHEKILQHYVSFTHDRTFNILLPLARYGDLEIFLNEGYNPVDPEDGNPNYDFPETFPTFDRDQTHCISDLFKQFWGIADAVKWLHSKETKSVYLIHMDLKPANIMVMEDFTKGEKHSSVGTWRLSDFGLSVDKSQRSNGSQSSSADNHARGAKRVTIYDALKQGDSNLTDSSRTVPQRREGTYQAPEVALQGRRDAVGPRSDVWSLACIFSEVIAFAVGGREKVAAFQVYRQRRHSDDFFYSAVATDRSSTSASRPRFKRRSTVDEWLRELATSQNSTNSNDWVECGVEVVLAALECNQDTRPDAASFCKDVSHFRDHYKHGDSAQAAESLCRLLRHDTTDLSTNDSGSGIVSRQTTQSNSIERTSSSGPSSLEVPFRLRRSQSSQSGVSAIGGVSDDLPRLACQSDSHTTLTLESLDMRAANKTAIDMTTCRSTNKLLALHASCLTLVDLISPTMQPMQYPLPSEIQWEQVKMAGCFAVALGHEGRGREGHKHVMLLNLEQPRTEQLHPSENPTLAKVSEIAVSHTGFVALQCDSKILLYNIGEDRVTGLSPSDSDGPQMPSNSTSGYLELSSDENYHFDKLEFSSSGYSLVVWGWGSQLKNAIFRWDLDSDPVYRRQYHLSGTKQQEAPTPVDSLLLSPQSEMDERINCIIRESTGDFFAVCLADVTEDSLPRDYIASNANAAWLTALFDHTHLITITRQRRTILRNRCYVAAYPLHWTALARSQSPDFDEEFKKLVKENEKYCMQVISDGTSLALAVVGFDGTFASVPLQKI